MIFKILSLLVHVINLFTIFYMVFKEKRSANSIIAWTLILYLLPYVGFIFFLLIGRKINNTNMYVMKANELKIYQDYSSQIKESICPDLGLLQHKNHDLIMAVKSMQYSPYRTCSDVQLFTDGKEFFDHLLAALENATTSINIQFYIFKNDDIGSRILKVLEEKAKTGVEVRLLYDSVGSRSLNRKTLKNLINAGAKTGEFFPAWLKLINLNMNFRNHRKIVVIDNKIGFVGGFNVGDEYLGKDPKFGYWRDTHIQFKDAAVKDLNLRFLADWRYATKEDITFSHVLDADASPHDLPLSAHSTGMQILSSGPNLSYVFEIKLAYLKMIQKARKYVYIQSPYLIIDKSIADSLKLAALSGVDVKIMLPGKGDHPFVYWANLVYAGELLPYGVKVYHYDKEAFLHAKTVVADDEVCSIGTANMDTRSFELNFEVNALIYSEEIATKQRLAFEKDLLCSKELLLEAYNARGTLVKFKESMSRLLSALL